MVLIYFSIVGLNSSKKGLSMEKLSGTKVEGSSLENLKTRYKTVLLLILTDFKNPAAFLSTPDFPG